MKYTFCSLQPHKITYFFVDIPGDLPTLQQFLFFPMPTSTVNLAQKIGTDYYNFSILILEDDGDRVEALQREFRERVEDINREVFCLWLKGNGRKPVSWSTLVSVLHDIGQTELASNIAKVKRL